MPKFDEVISDHARLREITGQSMGLAADKVIDHVDEHVAAFIARSPFLLISSRGSGGREDISPKGDPAGFVEVLDDRTLAIPDRPGNRRMDTFSNLIDDDRVGLIFLIPGHADTLRVAGRGKIVRDEKLAQKLSINGRKPELILIVTVESVMMHCPKCMIRSGLWKPETWPEMADFPSLARIIKDHGDKADMPLEQIEAAIEASARDRLY